MGLLPPIITASETVDLNEDGYIDAMHIIFSKPIDDSTVMADDFDVARVWGEAFSSITNGDTLDDADIYITFSDRVLNTDITPDVSYTAGTLTDLSGNPLATTGAISSTDKAAPVLMISMSTLGTSNLKLTFSEPVYTNPSGTGVLVAGDCVYTDTSGTGVGSIVGISDGNGSDRQVTFSVDIPFEQEDNYVDRIAAAANQIYDDEGNPASSSTVLIALVIVDHIVIRDAAGGKGVAISALSLSVNDHLTLYAAGYDANSMYIDDVAVTWGFTGNLDTVNPGPSSSVSLAPVTPATSGRITADDGSGHTASTGTITVIATKQGKVIIRNNVINPSKGELVYINFVLKKSEKVNITVYNLAGNPVKVIFNKKGVPGLNEVAWDGKNKKGRLVSRAVYYVLIKIGKTRYTRKVLIVK
jgi:hypothetical protein